MKKWMIVSMLALAAFGFSTVAASSALAADKAEKKKKAVDEGMFKKLDTTGDSKLSKEEFTKVIEEMAGKKFADDPAKKEKVLGKLGGKLEEQFTKLDENKDNSLSLDEFKKFNPADLRAK